MKKILWAAATLYLLLAPFTYHPDTKLVLFYPTLNNGKVWNIYTYLNTHQNNAPKFHYPPMNFWIGKLEWPLVHIVGGNSIQKWLGSNGNQAFESQRIFIDNLATKLPLLLLTILTGWLLGKIVLKNGGGQNLAKTATVFWLFNPVTLYAVVIMGQNDILAVFPFMVGLYFYFDNPLLAFILFGVGGSVKSFPLIWAGMLALVYPRVSWIKRLEFLIISGAVYGLTMVPFLRLPYFWKDVIFSGLSMRIFEIGISISPTIKIPIVPLFLLVLAMLALKQKMGKNLISVAKLLLTTTLIILGFSNFNPQWMVWLMPFTALIWSKREGKWFLWLLVSWLGIILMFNDKFLVWGLLTPLNHNLINWPTINEIMSQRGLPAEMINLGFHVMLATTGIYWFYRCFHE